VVNSRAPQPARQLHVLRLNRDAFSMNCAQVGVLKQGDEKRLSGLLEGADRGRLKSKGWVEVVCDFSSEALEWQFANQHLGGSLFRHQRRSIICKRTNHT
jgi:hypothetical protein